MLQETLECCRISKVKTKMGRSSFFSPGNKGSRGVSILISKNTPFKPTSVQQDNEGRFVIVAGLQHNEKVTLVNLYAPNI